MNSKNIITWISKININKMSIIMQKSLNRWTKMQELEIGWKTMIKSLLNCKTSMLKISKLMTKKFGKTNPTT